VICRNRIRLRCPSCKRVFCVPSACLFVSVWHRECKWRELERVGDDEEVVECERAVVSWFKDTGHNEVRTGQER
jgi:hypothetical protein